jgi:hypothetical protein
MTQDVLAHIWRQTVQVLDATENKDITLCAAAGLGALQGCSVQSDLLNGVVSEVSISSKSSPDAADAVETLVIRAQRDSHCILMTANIHYLLGFVDLKLEP